MSYTLRVKKKREILTHPAFIRALARALRQIAARTGQMRRDMAAHIIESIQNSGKYYIVDLSNHVISTMPLAYYMKYHTRQHQAFKQIWSRGYRNSTTPNTRPIERISLLRIIRKGIIQANDDKT